MSNQTPIDKNKKASEIADKDLDKVAGGTVKPPVVVNKPKPPKPEGVSPGESCKRT